MRPAARSLRRPFAAVVAAIAIVLAVLAFGGSSARIGKLAPPLPRTVLAGKAVTLASLRGKPAIIHFWASSCGPCTKEAPQLARLAAALDGRATLVGIDYGEDASVGLHFARAHKWTFPLLTDPFGAVGDRYAVRGLPTTFVINAKGRIVAQLLGAQTEAKLLAELKSAA